MNHQPAQPNGGSAGRPPVLAYRSAGPPPKRHSRSGAASCVLAAVSPAAVWALAAWHANRELQQVVLLLAAFGNLFGLGFALAGMTTPGRRPMLGVVGLLGNVVGWVLAAGVCAWPGSWH